jgi:hypothetical protein
MPEQGAEITTSSTDIASSETPRISQKGDRGAGFQVRFGCIWAASSDSGQI